MSSPTETQTESQSTWAHACAPAPHPVAANGRPASASAAGPDGALHAVFPQLEKLWTIGRNQENLLDAEVQAESVKLGRTIIVYKFNDPEPEAENPAAQDFAARKGAVEDTIKTWEEYANVLFVPKDKAKVDADIRISFRSPLSSSWSVVGAVPNTIPGTKATLNLGWLQASRKPNVSDRATILHEFGHVLGMMHEHQSPARGEAIHLKTEKVYDYYRPLLGYDDNLVKTQVIDMYDRSQSNFSHFDRHSIMMYFMPGSLNEENITIQPTLELSELDKAFITLAYPPKDPSKLLKAMGIIGVPDSDAIEIIKPLKDVSNELTGKDLADALVKIREAFFAYNKKRMASVAPLLSQKKTGTKQAATQHSPLFSLFQLWKVDSPSTFPQSIKTTL